MKQSIGSRTIAFPTPTWVVGTYDREGKPNIMAAAWGGICCSRPPCVYVSLRKATYSHGNIVSRGAYTVNIPAEQYVKEVDYFGIASGRDADKFSVSGLTPVKSSVVDAPYVEEFPLVLECKVLRIVELGLHTQFIGEIMDVKADPSTLTENGLPDITKVKPIIFEPSNRRYFGLGSCLGQAFSIGKALQSNQL
ncbi:MAG: flavin reductase family protein [Candidatus Bathyarchaeota archaeon]|nr:flavin reductase family protein [Candidatus Bathyarchaeota archaeon]